MTNLHPGAAVRYFMQVMGQPTPDTPQHGCLTTDRWDLRTSLIEEEYAELREAWVDCDEAAFLDACVDLVYVVVGAAVEAGLPFDEAFAAVHRSNMEKAPSCDQCFGTGRMHIVPLGPASDPIPDCGNCAGKGRIVKMRMDGKILKPIGWQAPNLAALIWKETTDARTTAVAPAE